MIFALEGQEYIILLLQTGREKFMPVYLIWKRKSCTALKICQ